MKNKSCTWVSLFLLVLLTIAAINGCTNQNNTDIKSIRITPDSTSIETGADYFIGPADNDIATLYALLDDSYVYLAFVNQETVIYRRYFDDRGAVIIGRIPDYVISTGGALFNQDVLYFNATVLNDDPNVNDGFRNVLYGINPADNTMREVCSDTYYLPAAYIRPFLDGILTLQSKRDGTLATVLQYYDLKTEQIINMTDVHELNEETRVGSYIINFCTSGNLIYALVLNGNSVNHSYVLQIYDETGILLGEINVDTVKDYIDNSRIGKIIVYGNFIYMRNFSRHGFIGLIEDNSIRVLATGSDLDVADAPNSANPPIFFERWTNRFLQLDVANQTVVTVPVPINKDNYIVMSALANDTDIVVILYEDDKERLLYYLPIYKLGSAALE